MTRSAIFQQHGDYITIIMWSNFRVIILKWGGDMKVTPFMGVENGTRNNQIDGLILLLFNSNEAVT